MKVVCIIPARLESSRLPNKILIDINGKTMIQHCYERTLKAKGIDEVIVATDHKDIKKNVESFGGTVVMTSKDHKTGTDRIAEVAANIDCDIVVNVQGDNVLLDPKDVENCLKPMLTDDSLTITTLATEIGLERAKNPNVVKIVFDKNNHVLYMSRSLVPYQKKPGKIFKHVGIYAFKRNFLLKFGSMEPTWLQQTESTELMRAVENGYKVKIVIAPKENLSINTKEELEMVKEILKKEI